MASYKLRERIMLVLIEEMNKTTLAEPENSIPAFLERSSVSLEELFLAEERHRGNRKA